MRAKLRSYLELVRVFLTLTAVADSFAGFVLARRVHVPSSSSVLDVVTAAACSVLAYWLGMVSNDLVDLEKDRVRAPTRPLASGRVSRREAAWMCSVLGFGALVCGALLEITPIVLALIALIALYNLGGKRIPVAGNLLMGAARGANFLLGAAAAVGVQAALSTPDVLWAASLLALYISGVTAVSLLEDRPFSRGGFLSRALPVLAIPVAFVVVAPAQLSIWVNSAVLILVLGAAMHGSASAGDDGPHAASLFVRQALGGIFFVDAGCLLAFASETGPPLAETSALYAGFAITWLWKRSWVRSTTPTTPTTPEPGSTTPEPG